MFDSAGNLSFGVKVSTVDRVNNIFRLKFQHEAHSSNRLTPLTEMDFSTTDFWVQIHGLTPICMLKENAHTIGNLMGNVSETDFSDNYNLIIEKYLRIRVQISVDSCIKAGYFYTKSDGSLA